MPIAKVRIEEGCISCGVCESICPQVFVVQDIAEVIKDVDFSQHEDCIKEAAEECPVAVIKYE